MPRTHEREHFVMQLHPDPVSVDESTKNLSVDQMKEIKAGLISSITSAFTGEDKARNQTWSMTVEIVDSAKKITDEHVFTLKDIVHLKAGKNPIARMRTDRDKGGVALISNSDVEGRRSGAVEGFGGNSVMLSLKHLMTKDGAKLSQPYAGWLMPHETGHTMGLQHTTAQANPVSFSDKAKNLMSPGSNGVSSVTAAQVDYSFKMHETGNLNQGHSSYSGLYLNYTEAEKKADDEL